MNREPSSPARKTATARLAVGLLTIVVLVGAAEAFCRLTWETPWYEKLSQERVDTGKRLPRFAVGEKEWFLRHAPERTPKPEGTYRILFLGDSFTYGMGVAEQETFVSAVAERLNGSRPHPSAERYEVYNAGVPGSYTNQWLTLFREIAPDFDPDLVISVFFLRDGVAGVTAHGQITRVGEEMARLTEESPLFRASYLYRRLRSRAAQRELSRTYMARLVAGYFGSEEETVEWKTARRVLRTIRDESEERGAAFAFVLFPMLFELGEDYPLQQVCDRIERFAESTGFDTLSLLPTFRGREAPELWLTPYDQHPNARGHALAADAIAVFLEGLIRARTGR